MSTIRILPEILSNQIAAGEVVQRPANAVKELVENSIDAGATRIRVEVEKGGKTLIRVSDDGVGLSRDDALLSIERYATSKLYKAEDLFSISTMGFRGEALPSIASVSKFTMVTRPRKSDVATKLVISGGRLQDVTDEGAPEGTMVEIRHLFYNTPARKKFLKSDQTEFSHIADTLWGMALGNPLIEFRLFSNGRLHKSFSHNQDLKQRAIEILGRETRDRLCALEYVENGLHVHGYCVNPMVTRSSTSKIFMFVNRRMVWERGLIAAMFRGYRGRIMKGRFPLGVLFIDVDHDQVDVNVHPSKREIKFFNAGRIYQAVGQAVENAVSGAQKDVRTYTETPLYSTPFEYGSPAGEISPSAKIAQQTLAFGAIPRKKSAALEKKEISDSATAKMLEKTIPEDQGPGIQNGVLPELERTDDFFESNAQKDLRIIGQVMGTYILAENHKGLMLIDQHAAHERIVYEKLCRRREILGPQAQQLAVPETMDLSHTEGAFMERHLQEFQKIGVDIQPFGGNTFVIKSVPALMDEKEVKPFILEIIDRAMADKELFKADAWLEDALILMACHSAVRANHQLTHLEMETLIKDLESCENSRHCPHGRPIVVFWDQGQLEKLFKRVV